MRDAHPRPQADPERRRAFIRRVLDDLRVLEQMLEQDSIESDVRRIGAEQELFLIDRSWRPAPAALQILERIDDPRFTTELGLFNLEMNLDPLVFGGDCLRSIETQLDDLLTKLRRVAGELGVDVVLAGILPTLRKSDLGLESMTPMPRYSALNEAMSAMRGGAYEFHIKGVDELLIKHDSVMVEACNASFQVHFQVGAAEFARLYNIAQVVAAPVLAAGVNSPLLFGRRLWSETRIALFEQAVDTRSSTDYLRDRSPRVSFGDRWVERSVIELFKEDISRFRAVVHSEWNGSTGTGLPADGIPTLEALRLHNGTVYRWNRACYGFTGGRPHLRIENRVLPAGPTVADQVANAAFWLGLISAMAQGEEDVRERIDFADAKMNFTAAARQGLGAQLRWFDGQTLPAANLICDRLLPLAREGLERGGIVAADIERYLGILERRVCRQRTGAQWALDSLAGMGNRGAPGERLNALTAAMVERQRRGLPVADWEPARLVEAGGWKHNFLKVEQFMSTELFTVAEDESLDLVACLMEWNRIRHVPVEDDEHRLVGLISYRSLLRMMARGELGREGPQVPVSEVMRRDPVTVDPGTSTLQAIELMREHQVGCLPVVKDGRLVGIVTDHDFMNVAAKLLADQLRG